MLYDVTTNGVAVYDHRTHRDKYESNYGNVIFNEFAANAAMSRQDLVRKMMDPRRDIDDECGYPKTPSMDVSLFRELYDRESIATRVVQVLPEETWQTQPKVFESEDSEIQTPFELAWDQLAKDLRVKSFYQDEQGSPIWEHLQRADTLSRIGHFGIILLGINDGKPLSEPIDGFDGDAGYQGTDEQYGNMGFGQGTDAQYSKPGYSTANEAGQEFLEGFSKLNAELFEKYKDQMTPRMVANFAPGGPKPPYKDNQETDDEEEGMKDEEQSPAQAQTTEEQGDEGDNPYVQAPADDEVSEDGDPHALTDDDEEGTEAMDADGEVDPDQIDTSELDPNDQPEVATKYKLQFIRAFDESLVSITRYDAQPSSPRYGQPTMYLLTLNDPSEQHSGIGLPLATLNVHWSRVIHIADQLGSSEIFGVPAMRPVFNRLYDLRKLYGGSAEMYWRGAFPGLAFETHPQLGGEVTIDKEDMRAQVERYQNTLQRYLTAEGMTVKSISPQVVDPSTQIDTQITAICIVLGIPKRIFMGSERGELASGQDDSTWTDRVEERQTNYVTPRIIIPFVDRLILIGVLPEPQGYSVSWPGLKQVGPAEQANIANTRTTAMATYLSGGVDTLMAPLDFLTRELGMDEAEAEAVLEATLQHMQTANPDANPEEMVPGHAPPEPQMTIDPETGEPMEVDPNDMGDEGDNADFGADEGDLEEDGGEEETSGDEESDAEAPPSRLASLGKKKPAFSQNVLAEYIDNNDWENQPRVPAGVTGGGRFGGTGYGMSASSRRRAKIRAAGMNPKGFRGSLRDLLSGTPGGHHNTRRDGTSKPHNGPQPQGEGNGKFVSRGAPSQQPMKIGFEDRQKIAFKSVSRYHLERAADDMIDSAVDKIVEGKNLLPPKGSRWKALKSRIKSYTVSALKAAAGATKEYARQEAYAAVEKGVGKGLDAILSTERGHGARMKILRSKRDAGKKIEAYKKGLKTKLIDNPKIRAEWTPKAKKFYKKYPHLDPTRKKVTNEMTMNEVYELKSLPPKSRVVILSDMIANELLQYVANFNPNHDEQGRFAEGAGDTGPEGKSVNKNKEAAAANIAGILGDHTNQYSDAHLDAFNDDINWALDQHENDRPGQMAEIMSVAKYHGLTKKEAPEFRSRVQSALDEYERSTRSTKTGIATGYVGGLAATGAGTAAGTAAGAWAGGALGGVFGAGAGAVPGAFIGGAIGGGLGSLAGGGAAHHLAGEYLGKQAQEASDWGGTTADLVSVGAGIKHAITKAGASKAAAKTVEKQAAKATGKLQTGAKVLKKVAPAAAEHTLATGARKTVEEVIEAKKQAALGRLNTPRKG